MMKFGTVVLSAIALLIASATAGHAQRSGGHGGGGGHAGIPGGGHGGAPGGFHGGGAPGGGHGGAPGGFHGGGAPGGGHGGGDFHHGGHGGGDFHHGGHGGGFHGEVFIGPGWWWGDPFWPYAYYPPYYAYPPPAYPPAYYDDESQEYTEREPESARGYWYYCPSSEQYYPQVRDCREEWVKVRPRPEN